MFDEAYEDYKIFTESCSHFQEIQQALGNSIRDYAATLTKPKIGALEIGCGYGDTTVQILNADPRIVLSVSEIDPEMITKTSNRIDEEGLICPNVCFYDKSILESCNPWPTGFDMVASGYTIHNFPDKGPGSKQEYYAGIAEMLKPGGFFGIADKCSYGDGSQYRESLARKMSDFAEYVLSQREDIPLGIRKRALERWMNHLLLDYEPGRLTHEETVHQQLAEVGFTDIKTVFRKETAAVITALKGG
jgi:tRNA (cmo5U34)-methyltransferase